MHLYFNNAATSAQPDTAWYWEDVNCTVPHNALPIWGTDTVTVVDGTLDQVPVGGTVDTNNRTIISNYGTVTNNASLIENNIGTIVTNMITGVVVYNGGTISLNMGAVGTAHTTFTPSACDSFSDVLLASTDNGVLKCTISIRNSSNTLVTPTSIVAVPYINGQLSSNIATYVSSVITGVYVINACFVAHALEVGDMLDIYVEVTIGTNKACKWYHSTFAPAASVDVTAIADATSAAVDAAITASHGAGPYDMSSGPGSVPIRVFAPDPQSRPIDGVAVRVYTDEGLTDLIAGPLYTGMDGYTPPFMLDGTSDEPITYYVMLQRGGYDFQNPVTVRVPST